MAKTPTTFRFDDQFLATLDALAQSMSSSRAEVIRQAVWHYEMGYRLKYSAARRFIERLRARHGDQAVITLVPGEGGDLDVLIDGQPTDEAEGFNVEILKGRDPEDYWISEEAQVYLHDPNGDDAVGPTNLIVGKIPFGPEGERRVGLSIRIAELKPEDVDFYRRVFGGE